MGNRFSNMGKTVFAIHEKQNGANEDDCYNAGYDCGMNGANTNNCAITYFSTKEKTTRWEAGKKQGDIDKQKGK